MSNFQSIAREQFVVPHFKLLFVGDNAARRDVILDQARASGIFERVDSVPRVNDAVGKREFACRGFRECLLVVLDLGAACRDEDLHVAFRQLVQKNPFDSQVVVFILAADHTALTFRTFIECVEHNVACVGSAGQCMESLAHWCGHQGDSTRAPDLRLGCIKRPSYWVRSILHDYLNQFSPLLEPQHNDREFWEAQCSIDFWQDALRSVLVSPCEDRPARSLQPKAKALDIQLYHAIDTMACPLLVPRSLLNDVAPNMRSDEQPVAYEDRDEALSLIERAEREGTGFVWVREPSPGTIDDQPVDRRTLRVPSVLLGDAAHRRTWRQWKAEFSHNTVGSFDRAEFLSKLSHDSFPRVKLKSWKAFCRLSMREAFGEILDKMMQRYEMLEGTDSDFKGDLFRCIAQVWCAQGLYFDSP